MFNQKAIVALLLAAAIILGLGGAATHASPNQFAVNVDNSGRAVAGYDTVAYFTDGKATKGRPEFAHVWKGAKWLFASAEHRDLFRANPESYAPRVGGFCALGTVNGRMVEVDPEMWLIVKGRLYLYLYLDAGVRDAANADLEASTAAAEEGWEQIRQAQ